LQRRSQHRRRRWLLNEDSFASRRLPIKHSETCTSWRTTGGKYCRVCYPEICGLLSSSREDDHRRHGTCFSGEYDHTDNDIGPFSRIRNSPRSPFNRSDPGHLRSASRRIITSSQVERENQGPEGGVHVSSVDQASRLVLKLAYRKAP
jgi:hypothetical protein